MSCCVPREHWWQLGCRCRNACKWAISLQRLGRVGELLHDELGLSVGWCGHALRDRGPRAWAPLCQSTFNSRTRTKAAPSDVVELRGSRDCWTQRGVTTSVLVDAVLLGTYAPARHRDVGGARAVRPGGTSDSARARRSRDAPSALVEADLSSTDSSPASRDRGISHLAHLRGGLFQRRDVDLDDSRNIQPNYGD